jgi:hypothetical protein
MGGASQPSGPKPGYTQGQTKWYVNPAGLAADPNSSSNWSTTPRAGWVEATPTGRMRQAQYDPNNQYIPEFMLPDGRTFMGLDRGPGDGSRTSARLYGQQQPMPTEPVKDTSAETAEKQKTANRAQGRARTSTTGPGGLLGMATVRRRNLLGA